MVCFQVLSVVNKTVINIHGYFFVCLFVVDVSFQSNGWILRSTIVGWYGRSILTVVRNWQCLPKQQFFNEDNSASLLKTTGLWLENSKWWEAPPALISFSFLSYFLAIFFNVWYSSFLSLGVLHFTHQARIYERFRCA